MSLMAWGVGSKDKTACGLSDRRERNHQKVTRRAVRGCQLEQRETLNALPLRKGSIHPSWWLGDSLPGVLRTFEKL